MACVKAAWPCLAAGDKVVSVELLRHVLGQGFIPVCQGFVLQVGEVLQKGGGFLVLQGLLMGLEPEGWQGQQDSCRHQPGASPPVKGFGQGVCQGVLGVQ